MSAQIGAVQISYGAVVNLIHTRAGGRALRPRRLRYLAVVLTAVFGTLASTGVFLMIGWWEYHLTEIGFQDQARDRLRIMASDFQASSRLLYTLRAYVASADRSVSRSEFIRFSETIHSEVASLRDTGWAPRVALADRAAFEREVAATGVPGFQITERDGAGQMVRAAERPEYFPILYSQGDHDPMRVVGLDVAFEPVRRAAIQRAIATGKPAATPPVQLVTKSSPKGGLMSFLALDGNRADGTPATQGVILGAFDVVAMIDNIVAAKSDLTDIDVYFFEPGATPDDPPNYARNAPADDRPVPTQRALLARTHWCGKVAVIDQQWTAIFAPAAPLQAKAWHWQTAMPLVIGLTMTAMIVAYMLVSLYRTAQLEELTSSLNRTTAELRRNVAQITHMARHDLLTGLPNRALFKERLDQAVSFLSRGRPFSLLFLDLDKFKAVNDTFGHAAGDQLLRNASERMQACLREIDTLARLGGDEFAMVLHETATPAAVMLVAQRLIDVVSDPYDIDGHTAFIGVSIGIAVAPDDGDDPELLQMRADRALYAAKRAGRGTACFFAPHLDAAVAASA